MARPVRILSAVGVCVCCLFIYLLGSLARSPLRNTFRMKKFRDPLLEPTKEPEGVLWRARGDMYAANNTNSSRINATFLSLVRNEELDGILRSMKEVESTFNSKFNYPWTFFNDKPFSDEFKRRTQAATKAQVRYELVPKEHWDMPEHINPQLYQESNALLKQNKVNYAGKKSYQQMCRWNSGMFYRHPALKDMQYYWRVEPNVHYFCDVDYDVFRYMQDNQKVYGFVINLYDSPHTIPSLWPETVKFISSHPEHMAQNNAMNWLVDGKYRPKHHELAHGYSTCHFWSNFEIADLTFFRSEAYEEYFKHLDRSGGFFYERWGDAPVHSIAVGLLLDKSKIHWFRDIGYNHAPYINCPNTPKCHKRCKAGQFYAGKEFLAIEDCRPSYFEHVHTD